MWPGSAEPAIQDCGHIYNTSSLYIFVHIHPLDAPGTTRPAFQRAASTTQESLTTIQDQVSGVTGRTGGLASGPLGHWAEARWAWAPPNGCEALKSSKKLWSMQSPRNDGQEYPFRRMCVCMYVGMQVCMYVQVFSSCCRRMWSNIDCCNGF